MIKRKMSVLMVFVFAAVMLSVGIVLNTAKAEALNTAELISGGANATVSANTALNESAHTGLSVSKGDAGNAYSGGFNGIFSGDTTLEFAFPHALADGVNDTQFVFTVSSSEGDLFQVVFRTSGFYTAAYVVHNGQIRSYKVDGSTGNWNVPVIFYRMPKEDQQMVKPGLGANMKDEKGLLKLRWTEDVLDVVVLNRGEGGEIVIASFDGSNKSATALADTFVRQDTHPDDFTWGLPKLNQSAWANYTIDFQMNGVSDVPVTFTSINGIDLAAASLSDAPSFYTAWDDATVAATKLITPTDASVTAAHVSSGKTKPHKGLAVAPQTAGQAYSGKINGVYTGDTRIDFSFLGTEAFESYRGSFTFTFTDVANASKFFTVTYKTTSWWNNVYVTYGSEERTTGHAASEPIYDQTSSNSYRGTYADSAITSPSFGLEGGDLKESGYLGIRFNGDVLEVYVSGYSLGERVITRFDGTAAVNSDTKAFGLPKLSFPEGYAISFSSGTGSGVLFEALSGKFSQGTNIVPPTAFLRWENTVEITVENDIQQLVRPSESVYIPTATYIQPSKEDSTATAVEKVEIKLDNGAFEAVTAGQNYTPSAEGVYTVRYTAVDGESYIGNTRDMTFTVDSTAISTTGLITTTDAVTESAYEFTKTARHKGLKIAPETAGEAYSGKINGVYSGDMRLDFSFLANAASGSYTNEDITFTIADVTNPSNTFTITFCRLDEWLATAHVTYNGNIRSSAAWNNTLYDIKGGANTVVVPCIGTGPADKPADETGYFQLKWAGDVLEVRVKGTGDNGERVIAKFDGTTELKAVGTAINGAENTYGLPKLNFAAGYTVSFNSTAGSSVCVKSVKGVATTNLETENIMPTAEYQAWKNMVEISLDAQIAAMALPNTKIYIPKATYIVPASGNTQPQNVQKTEIKVGDGAFATLVTDNDGYYQIASEGTYTVRYTAVSGESYVGNVVEISFIASAAYFETEKLAYADDKATVTAATDVLSNGQKGLTVSPKSAENAAYSGELNGLFGGDTSLNFAFPHGLSAGVGGTSFTFTVTAMNGEEIKITYRVETDGGTHTAAFVTYGNEIRSYSFDGKIGGWNRATIAYRMPVGDEQLVKPGLGHAADSMGTGVLRLKWTGDVLSVIVSNRTGGNTTPEKGGEITIAQFDGSKKSTAGQAQGYVVYDGERDITPNEDTTEYENPDYTWGLPKLDQTAWANYHIRFETNGMSEIPVTFTAINGASTAGNLLSATPGYYTDWLGYTRIQLSGRPKTAGRIGAAFTVPSASYYYRNGALQTVSKIEVTDTQSNKTDITSTRSFVPLVSGTYTVTYTALAEALFGKTYAYAFTADDYTYASTLVAATDAKVMGGYEVTDKTQPHEGLAVIPNETGTAYSGAFDGTFNGDMRVDFSFLGTEAFENYKGEFVFTVASATDATKFFTVTYKTTGWNNNVYVTYGTEERTTAHAESNTIFDQTQRDKYVGTWAEDAVTSPTFGLEVKDRSENGYLGIRFNGDVLEVYVSGYLTGERVIARFDGTNEVDNDTKAFGLPKLDFAGGYTVVFSSAKGSGVCFEALNGTVLDNAYLVNGAGANLSNGTITLLNGAALQFGATQDIVDIRTTGAGATFGYDLSIGSFATSGSYTVYPEDEIDFTVVATHTFTYQFLGATETQTLSLVDLPPILDFAGGIDEETVFRKGGQLADSLTVNKGDIVAVDSLDGTVAPESITVMIKGPNDAEFSAYTFGDFVPESFGVYIVRYYAEDSGANRAYIDRKITVIDGNIPVITVDGTIPETALIKSSLTLPTATATDNGETVEVVRAVYYNDTLIEITGNTLTFDKAGVYKIVYYAVDADDHEVTTTYTVTVSEDEDKPVLSAVELPKTATVGKVITIPTVTASDEVDGAVTVVVKVYYGTEEVTVTDGKFKVDKVGIYRVVFTATDAAQNTAEAEFSIEVSKKSSGCKKSVNFPVSAAAVLLLGAALVLIKKRKTAK